MLRTTIAFAWGAWKIFTRDSINQRALLASAMAHWRQMLLAKLWTCWVARVHAHANYVEIFCKCFTIRTLATFFRRWMVIVGEQKVTKASSSSLITSLSCWIALVSQRIELESLKSNFHSRLKYVN